MGLRWETQRNNAVIAKSMEKFLKELQSRHFELLTYVGEQFINWARQNEFASKAKKGAYKDRTGNLRGSTGYIIGFDGKIKKTDITGTAEGTQAARSLANEILRKNNKGFVLIAVAGMEYASSVEAKGYDVISASSEEAADLLKELIQKVK